MNPALRPAASVIAVHRGSPDLLLWVRRSEANPFLGGFHSFPGGRWAKEDGPMPEDPEAALPTMARCAARELFEETGLLVGFRGTPPALEEQRRVRQLVLDGALEFWPTVKAWGLAFDDSAYVPCGRWITPHFSRARFNTQFFLVLVEGSPPEVDVWPGELESGGWMDPRAALREWEEERIVLAMPTLHTIRVLAEGSHGLPDRLHAIPEANGVPSRHVHVRPAITMVPLRTETIPPATHTNAVVVGDGDVVIIDPGTDAPDELEALDRVVEEALQPGGRVLAVLLTHDHRDHMGGVAAVRALYDAPVWAHLLVSDSLPVDRALAEGDVIEIPGRHPRRLRVLETPGHARAHLAFFEETSATVIAGDLVSGPSTIVIASPDGNLRAYLDSLERVRALGARTLVPGHGPPNRGVDALLAERIEHRRMRERRVLDALAGGALDLTALRQRVYADTPGADPGLAAKTLEAHLEKLEEEGRVRREGSRVALAGESGAAPAAGERGAAPAAREPGDPAGGRDG
jgi:glyoxylase-like metal-dependent hydrolase (beta-lactamase superfamily II)/8-oxo-dGTP pyrophosphatase MutT (NUDIX family)